MKLPFSIDRSDDMTLADQMLQGLKKAIVHGVYKPGQMLPLHQYNYSLYQKI